MQALSILPSASESWTNCVKSQSNFESYSLHNSDKRNKRLDIRSGVIYLSSNLRFFRNGASCRSINSDAKCRFFSLYAKSEIHFRFKPKKGSFGKSFALTLEEPTVGDNITAEHLEISGEDNVEKTGVQLVEVKDENSTLNANNGGDVKGNDEGQNGQKIHKPSRARVNVLALGLSLHSAKTVDEVEVLLKDISELPLQVYSSIIRGFGKDKKIDAAIALFDWLKMKSKVNENSPLRPNLFIYNSLLGAMKQAQKFDTVDQIMTDMVSAGVNPNVVTYNTLMGIHIEQSQETEALKTFQEMQEKGIVPSPASYSIVLLAYRRMEDGFGALTFFTGIVDRYQKGEIGKDSDVEWELEFDKLEDFTIRICYQVLRRWLVKTENLSTEVLKLLKEMDKAGLQPSREEHERLIWACTREEHFIVGKELYARIRETDTDISLSVCNHVIWLMGKAKKWWAALEVYEDLLDKGPKPNHMSYELVVSHFNILLNAARKKGIWRWGVRLLNKMEEKGLKPGSREWNSVLVACSKASETSAAVEIFKRMVEQGEKPTIISYGALLSALEKGKLYDEAIKVWKHMIKMKVEPNLYAYTILASIYSGKKEFDTVDSVINEMAEVGIEPSVVTFNAIISSCARNGAGSVGYEWFQRMELRNITPNEVTYEMLIEGLANDEKPRLAYELYLRAGKEGLFLSAKAYDAVIKCSRVYGATVDVGALGARPMEKKKAVHIRKNVSEFCDLAGVPRRSRPFEREEIYRSKVE